MSITKDGFFDRGHITKPREVRLPDGESIFVRPLSGSGRDAFASAQQRGREELGTATLIAYCACDETGKLLFCKDDIERISNMPVSLIGPIAEAIIEDAGLGANAVEEEVKN